MRTSTIITRIAIAALSAFGALALIATPAMALRPATLHCGDTISANVTLARDLTNCPGDGLVIGADGIIVDLHGHTIEGTGTSSDCDRPPVSRAGIRDAGGFDRITIENGTISRFDAGVDSGSDTAGMSDSRVHDITFANDHGGVEIGGGAGAAATARNRIDQNTVTNACSDAIGVHSGQDNRVDSNRLEHVGIGVDICCAQAAVENSARGNTVIDAHFGGIAVFDSAGQVTANTIDGSGDTGIYIAGASAHLLVARNSVTHTQQAGVLIESCCGDTPNHPTDIHLIDNIVTATGDGLVVFDSNDDEIRGNTVTRSGSFGDPGDFGVGLVVDSGRAEIVAHNLFSNTRGPGIVVGLPAEFGPTAAPVTDNIVRHNTVIEAGNDGILVSPVAHNTTLDHNVAERGAADGIHVLSSATTLAHNTANDNAAFGIEAIAGVTDGGGNRATGNGAATQCSGVHCR